MGLFMGFSFISIAEFIYYAILRPYHVIKRHERVRNNNARNQNIQPSQIRFISPPRNPLNHINIPEHLVRSTKLQKFPHTHKFVRRYSDQPDEFIKQ